MANGCLVFHSAVLTKLHLRCLFRSPSWTAYFNREKMLLSSIFSFPNRGVTSLPDGFGISGRDMGPFETPCLNSSVFFVIKWPQNMKDSPATCAWSLPAKPVYGRLLIPILMVTVLIVQHVKRVSATIAFTSGSVRVIIARMKLKNIAWGA